MTNSIGVIETKSLAAAAEMLNRILNSYTVELLKTEFPGNGFITIFLTGEYSQMKYSISEAEKVSADFAVYFKSSIITKPDERLFELFESPVKKKLKETEIQKPKVEKQKITISNEIIVNGKPKKEQTKAEKDLNPEANNQLFKRFTKRVRLGKKDNDNSQNRQIKLVQKSVIDPANIRADNPTIAKLRMEALGKSDTEPKVIKSDLSFSSENGNGILSMEQLQQLNVHRLRRYARNFENFPIKGREISRANRQELLNHFKDLI